jgi:quinol monooxygenase YgiN
MQMLPDPQPTQPRALGADPAEPSPRTEPVIVLATFRPRPDTLDRVRAALITAAARVHAEPGCELYALHEGKDGRLVLVEKWTSAADLETHKVADSVRDLYATTGADLAVPVEVLTLAPHPAGDATRGAL